MVAEGRLSLSDRAVALFVNALVQSMANALENAAAQHRRLSGRCLRIN